MKVLGKNWSFNENSLDTMLCAYTTGPLRVIRKTRLYIPLIGKIRFPIPGADCLICYYPDYIDVFITIAKRPVIGAMIGEMEAIFGTDFRPETTKGARFYSQFYPEGVEVDGEMSARERTFSTKRITKDNVHNYWWYVTCPGGGMLRRGLYETTISATSEKPKPFDLSKVEVTAAYSDDRNIKEAPEECPGNCGYSSVRLYIPDVGKLEKGAYTTLQQWIFLPPHTEKDPFRYETHVLPYLNILNNPIIARVEK